MLYIVQGDLLHSDCDMIIHQVNCKGVMGSGIAAQIRNLYPRHYRDYMTAYYDGKLKLGNIVVTKLPSGLTIVGLCAQNDYGKSKRYTNYTAFSKCLETLKPVINDLKPQKIGMPLGIGCGRGGGEWKVVEQLIIKALPGLKIYLYQKKLQKDNKKLFSDIGLLNKYPLIQRKI